MLEKAYIEIAKHLRNKNFREQLQIARDFNSSGDVVKQDDLICNNIIIKYLKDSHLNIIGYISEEVKTFVPLKKNISDGENEYIVAFDPLDGSLNADFNINTGTIYALYLYDKKTNTINDIIKAGYCLYGSSTVMVETHYDEVIMKVLQNDVFIECKKLYFKDDAKIKFISINNEEYDPEIRFLKQQYQGYKHRWVGTMVADAHRLLLNDGLFLYTSTQQNPNGKIRYYYEALPMAYIFSKAGGIGLNSGYSSILDTVKNSKLKNIHISVSIILCSLSEYINMKRLINIFNND